MDPADEQAEDPFHRAHVEGGIEVSGTERAWSGAGPVFREENTEPALASPGIERDTWA